MSVMDCWSLPATLVPTHSHTPPSSLLTGDIVNDPVPSPLSEERRGVELLGTSPPLRNQVTVGVGLPAVVQERVTSEPSTTVMTASRAETAGATGRERG